MDRKILLIILIIFVLATVAGCDSRKINAASITSPTPEPGPKLSVSGEKCDLNYDEIFSHNGKTVFSECEIRKNAELFNGRTVRISSKYGFMIHGSLLTSDGCDLSKSIDELISVGMKEKDFDFLRDKRRQRALVDIVAVGVFSVSKPTRKTDTIYDRTPFHFSIDCLEKAELVKKTP